VKDYRRLLAYLRPYLWPRVAIALLTMVAFSGLEASVPFVLKNAVGDLLKHPDAAMLRFWAEVVLLVGFARGILSLGAGYLSDWVGQRIITDLRNDLTTHLQRLDVQFFNRQRAGQIVSRIMADVTLVRAAVTDALKSLLQDSLTLLGLVGAALKLDAALAGLAILVFPLAALPIRFVSVRIRQNTRRQQEATGRLNSMLHENIQGNRVIKAFGQERYEATRLHGQDELIFRLFLRASILRAIPVTEVLAAVAIAGILWYGGSTVLEGTRKVEDFAAFLLALALLYEPFKKLVRSNYTIQQGLGGAERVFGFLDTVPEIEDRPGARALAGVGSGIALERVSFEYEPERAVLHDVDLRIPAGHVVALVGMSGGGKSTIADLLPRFYDVAAGRITIDGHDVRELTLASLRAHMAVVTQTTFLFNDTVRANIAYGRVDASAAEIEAAARAANAHEFIAGLPKGYDTQIGDLGIRLSGGQRQRLAIARAILKDAQILILDEATSALDTESEGLVQEALERLMEHRTTLVIAHRLSTVRRADRIVVLSHGRVVEEGTHDELLERGGEYRKLYELQFGAEGEPEPTAGLPVAAGAGPVRG
jgi:subfamily B ATP-binding cassette protein MsbA